MTPALPAFFQHIDDEFGDVFGVVAAAVVSAFEGEVYVLESFVHAELLWEGVDEGEEIFGVNVGAAEGVLDAGGFALAFELGAVEVAPGEPRAVEAMILVFE